MANPNIPVVCTSMPPKQFIGAVEDHWELYSDTASDYTMGAPIGFGASSIVYAAHYKPVSRPPIPVALKVLDLDSLPPRSLSLLQRETTLMSLSKHPNVLRVRGSWMDGHKLYIAMRLMNKGSAADVMRYGWPGGMEEDVVRCILRQALSGLNYLHINGFIHRDIKAANLLIDDDGTVLLGDLGVAANLAEDSSQQQHSPRSKRTPSHDSGRRVVLVDTPAARPKIYKRKSFVGTPCWMAPELIQGHTYDASADIWSFGITALELTQGRPPRSRESPQKVLLKTIQEAPPILDREGGTYKYSRAFQEMVASCLVKDPSKRPTAEELLETPFFKGAKKPSYLIDAILKDLPPLAHRQERRIVSAAQHTHRSVDSWDFTTTIQSRRLVLHDREEVEEKKEEEEEEVKWLDKDSDEDDSERGDKRHSRSGVEVVPEEESEDTSASSDVGDSTSETTPDELVPIMDEEYETGIPHPKVAKRKSSTPQSEEGMVASPIPEMESMGTITHMPSSSLPYGRSPGLWHKLKKNATNIKRSASFSSGRTKQEK